MTDIFKTNAQTGEVEIDGSAAERIQQLFDESVDQRAAELVEQLADGLMDVQTDYEELRELYEALIDQINRSLREEIEPLLKAVAMLAGVDIENAAALARRFAKDSSSNDWADPVEYDAVERNRASIKGNGGSKPAMPVTEEYDPQKHLAELHQNQRQAIYHNTITRLEKSRRWT
jgi:hypothetical protein